VSAGVYAFSPRGALRMWQRNATVGRTTIITTLTPRFLEAIAYLAIMGLGLGTYVATIQGVDYVDFIAPGVAAATVMFGAIIETTYNSFVRNPRAPGGARRWSPPRCRWPTWWWASICGRRRRRAYGCVFLW